jgi:hypothetical protein
MKFTEKPEAPRKKVESVERYGRYVDLGARNQPRGENKERK